MRDGADGESAIAGSWSGGNAGLDPLRTSAFKTWALGLGTRVPWTWALASRASWRPGLAQALQPTVRDHRGRKWLS